MKNLITTYRKLIFYCDMAIVIGDCEILPDAEVVKILPAEPKQGDLLEILHSLMDDA